MSLIFETVFFKNFKTFRKPCNFTLHRPPGLYYIGGINLVTPAMGANAAGKSTMWDGVYWCLFGRTMRDSRPGAHVVNWKYRSERAVIILVLSINGVRHRIKRSRNPIGLWLDGVKITQQELLSKLGIDETVFKYTTIMGQFGDLFLDLKSEQQIALFNDTLGLGNWSKAAKFAEEQAKIQLDGVWKLELAGQSFTAARTSCINKLLDAKLRVKKFAQTQADAAAALEAEIVSTEQQRIADKEKQAKLNVAGKDNSNTVKALTQVRWGLATASKELTHGINDLCEQITDTQQRLKAYNKGLCPECRQPVASDEHIEKLKVDTKKLKRTLRDEMVKQKKTDTKLAHATGRLKAAENYAANRALMQEKLNIVNRSLGAAEAKLDQLNQRLKLIKEQGNPHEQTVTSLQKELKVIGDKAKAAAKDVKILQRKAARRKKWAEGFREMRLQVLQEVLTELEVGSTQYAEELGLTGWQMKASVEREKADGSLSFGFNVQLIPPGHRNGTKITAVKWENYSGGEVQRWRLAATFALSDAILSRSGMQSNIEVLDEPTRGCSSKGINQLLDYLSDRAIKEQKAIYIVDHHSMDKGQFTDRIMVVKDKSGSRIEEGK